MYNAQLFGHTRVEYDHICDYMWLPRLRILVMNLFCCRVLRIYTKSCPRTSLMGFLKHSFPGSYGVHFWHPAAYHVQLSIHMAAVVPPRVGLLHLKRHMGMRECFLQLCIKLQLPPQCRVGASNLTGWYVHCTFILKYTSKTIQDLFLCAN
jgi:hypothetical protein